MAMTRAAFYWVLVPFTVGLYAFLLAGCDAGSSLSENDDCGHSLSKVGDQVSASCNNLKDTDSAAIFEVKVGGESFHIALATGDQIGLAEEAIQSGRKGVISGSLERGDGGFNEGYSWHLDPESIAFPDVAMELCDGEPGFVESDPDYWIDTVGVYCPWAAEVVGRLDDE